MDNAWKTSGAKISHNFPVINLVSLLSLISLFISLSLPLSPLPSLSHA
jgi:hypothetical protein